MVPATDVRLTVRDKYQYPFELQNPTFTLLLFTLRTPRRAPPVADPFTTFLVAVRNLPPLPGSAPLSPLV